MTFLNPLLLFGLVGIASPIIIHLLSKQQIRRVPWAAMKWVRVTVERNQRRLNLQDLLLLLLRVACLALLAFGLSRPTVKQSPFLLMGEGGDEVALIALDVSGSMAQTDGVASRFDKAQQAAEEVLDSLPSGAGVAFWLISDGVEMVIPEPVRDHSRVRKAIRDARRTDRATDWHSAITSGAEVLQRSKAASRQIFAITDAQASGWRQLGETRAVLEARKTQVALRIVIVGAREPRNLSLTSLSLGSALAPVNQSLRFDVDVGNFGTEDESAIGVTLQIDSEAPCDQQMIQFIPAGEVRKASLYARFTEPGVHSVTAFLTGDRAPADDRRSLAMRVIAEVQVLLVDGDKSGQPRDAETFYLRHALVPVAARDRENFYVRARTVTPAEFDNERLADVQAIYLCNVVDLSERAVLGLVERVKAGAGLVIFPGDRMSLRFANEELFQKHGLAPAMFGELREDLTNASGGFKLQAAGYTHGIVQPWQNPGAGSLASALFYRAHALLPDTAARDVAGLPTVILKFEDGQIAAVERSFGRGLVVQFASTADAAWNDLCVRPVYLPLMHRVLGWMLSRADERLNVPTGAPFRHPMPADLTGRDVRIAKPDGREAFRKVEARAGEPWIEFAETALAGAYPIAPVGDATPALTFSAQANPEESALDELTIGDLKSLEPIVQVIRWEKDGMLRSALVRERTGSELWMLFAVLAFGVLIAEGVMANRWSGSK